MRGMDAVAQPLCNKGGDRRLTSKNALTDGSPIHAHVGIGVVEAVGDPRSLVEVIETTSICGRCCTGPAERMPSTRWWEPDGGSGTANE